MCEHGHSDSTAVKALPQDSKVQSEPSTCRQKKNRLENKVLVILTIMIVLTWGAALILWVTNLVDLIIAKSLVLSESSMTYPWWEKFPVEPTFKLYIYNYTNVGAFSKGNETLQVKEIGPYTYKETISKVNIQFHDEDGTVSFQEKREFQFVPELSVGSLDDVLMVPNIPMLTLMNLLQDSNFFVKLTISTVLTSLKVGPFLNVTVNDLLWGYEDKLFQIGQTVLPDRYVLPIEKFGLLAPMNMTSPDIVTLHTGAHNLSLMGVLYKINGNEKQNIWHEEGECNRLDGVDITLMPPFIDKDSTIYIYNREVCFRLPLVYEEDASVNNVPVFKFQPPKNMLGNFRENPENLCYYPDGPPYPFSGVLNISPCKFGAPLMISFPHFYQGDEELFNQVQGLHPDKEKHETYFYIAKKFGIPLGGKGRLQLNIMAKKTKGVRHMKAFQEDTLLPITWFEEGVDPNEMPDHIVRVVQIALIASHLIIYILLCLGSVCLPFFVWFLSKKFSLRWPIILVKRKASIETWKMPEKLEPTMNGKVKK